MSNKSLHVKDAGSNKYDYLTGIARAGPRQSSDRGSAATRHRIQAISRCPAEYSQQFEALGVR
jgi:hypothetical protein